MRAAIYLRISQDRIGERAGVTRQRADCERRAADRGWTVVEVHEDNDQSAKSGRRREGFEALLAAIESGSVGAVVAWSVDRLQRNRRDEVRLYELCRQHNVVLSLVNGPELDFNTAAGRFVADSLGSVARLEVELKGDRQRAANEQRAKAGKRTGGRRPFGYEADGVMVRESEAELVRAAYADYLAGAALSAIARSWNSKGMPTTQDSWSKRPGASVAPKWTWDTVRMVLRNPRNAGLRAYKGEIVAEAEWPALVSEETWRAAASKIEAGRRPREPRVTRHLLSGLALCGACGRPGAVVHGGGSARRGVTAYRCAQTDGHFARMAQPVNEYVEAVMIARLQQPDAALLLQRESGVDVERLREEANALRGRMESVAVEFADGDLTAAQLRTVNERLRTRLAEVESALADEGRVDLLGPVIGADDVTAAWVILDQDRKRAIIDLLATVVIYPPGRGVRTFRPETVEIRWKGNDA